MQLPTPLSHAANFYPRPPRGGRRLDRVRSKTSWIFLSTPSARRATSGPRSMQSAIRHFYPRPPRGGRPIPRNSWLGTKKFLSTPSARRATARHRSRSHGARHFYPRPPRGGRRRHGHYHVHPHDISIHALREEGDCAVSSNTSRKEEFLSTPSARRATKCRSSCSCRCSISIHALREEGDNAVSS